MPVLRNVPADPFDLVLQGEQMRVAAMATGVEWPQAMMPLVEGDHSAMAMGPVMLVEGEQNYGSMVGGYPVPGREVLRDPFNGSLVSVGAGLTTPCGAWVPTRSAGRMLNPFVQASVRWAVSGVTKDSAGAALGNCRVIGFEAGRMTRDTMEAEVGETISDGSGNYSLPVPLNTAYQLTAYKPGSPDVAGITRNDVVPSAIG